MDIYCSKSSNGLGDDQSAGYEVVTSLVSGLEQKGYVIVIIIDLQI